MKRRLEVKIDGIWQYVFCRNTLQSAPIITQDRQKALRGDIYTKCYFQQWFPDFEFRIELKRETEF